MEQGHEAALRSLNLKITPRRVSVLKILSEQPIYLSPEEVWQEMRRRFRTVGLPTVYRILDQLSEKGLIFKVIHADRKLYYYLCRTRDHHHHFVCVSCRKVEEVDFCRGREIELSVEERVKGKVFSHFIQLDGLCEACLRETRDHGETVE